MELGMVTGMGGHKEEEGEKWGWKGRERERGEGVENWGHTAHMSTSVEVVRLEMHGARHDTRYTSLLRSWEV